MNKPGLNLLLTETDIDTPLGISKLKSIWPELSLEQQLDILGNFKDNSKTIPISVLHVILAHSLPLVKNIAIRLSLLHEDTPETKLLAKQILKDPDPLVKYAISSSIRDGDKVRPFTQMSHEERLADLADDDAPKGEDFSATIRELIKNGIDEHELVELIRQYACSSELNHGFEVTPYDGDVWYWQRTNFEHLWKLVLDLPEAAAWPLIEKLQTTTPNDDDVPDEVLKALKPCQVVQLLYRKDVKLPEFRRKVFFDKTGNYDDASRAAACQFNFSLSDKELNEIFENSQTEIISDLSKADCLPPVQLLAIETYLAELPDTKGYGDAAWARLSQERSFDSLKNASGADKELIEHAQRLVRLFELACEILPWGTTEFKWDELYLEDDQKYLKEIVTAKTTWGVYLQLKARLRDRPLERKLISYFGPYDGNKDEVMDYHDEDEEETEDQLKQIIQRLDKYDAAMSQHLLMVLSQIRAMKKFGWVVAIGMLIVLYKLL